MKPSEVLFHAARIVERDGHCKHTYTTGDSELGPVCSHGGISRAVNGNAFTFMIKVPAHRLALEYFRAEIGTRNISVWNDAPERTPTEVIDALNHAAKRALEDELAAS